MKLDATGQRTLHLGLTAFWAVITPPAVILIVVYRDHPLAAGITLAWITLVSHYANFATHWAAYQASRVEVKQDVQMNVDAEDVNVQVSGDEGEDKGAGVSV